MTEGDIGILAATHQHLYERVQLVLSWRFQVPKTCVPGIFLNVSPGVGLYLDILPAFAGNGVMFKCDRCYDRLARGESPACIEACPEEMQVIWPRDEIIARACTIAAEIKGYLTRTIHYMGAVLLLTLMVYAGLDFLLLKLKRFKLTGVGYVRIANMACIDISGIFIVVKNFQYVHLSDGLTIGLNLSHLGAVMALLFANLAALISKKRWTVPCC